MTEPLVTQRWIFIHWHRLRAILEATLQLIIVQWLLTF